MQRQAHTRNVFIRAAAYSLSVVFGLLPLPSMAQFFGGGGEILADTILELEDLKAQCIRPEERAIFEYAKSLKRLEWYRSEYFSDVDEHKLQILSYGIIQKDTGRPVLPGYRDIRDTPPSADTERDPYALVRSNFPNFYWHSKPKPQYSVRECALSAAKWLETASEVERRLPPPFPEVRKYLDLAYPDDLLGISKKIFVCGNVRHFSSETRFDAWLSNSFSKSYGKRDVASPLVSGSCSVSWAPLGQQQEPQRRSASVPQAKPAAQHWTGT